MVLRFASWFGGSHRWALWFSASLRGLGPSPLRGAAHHYAAVDHAAIKADPNCEDARRLWFSASLRGLAARTDGPYGSPLRFVVWAHRRFVVLRTTTLQLTMRL